MSITDPTVSQKKCDWDEQALGNIDCCQQVCRQVSEEQFLSITEDISLKLELHNEKYSLLDVGCGNGYLLSHLLEHCSAVAGSDFSHEMIQKARKTIPSGEFSCGEALELPFSDNHFERVLVYSVFHYFPTEAYARKVISEALRVCKPGGQVLFGDLLDQSKEEKFKGESDMKYEKTIPLIQRYSGWLFLNLKETLNYIETMGCRGEILSQAEKWPLSSYRKDIKVWVA
jgi:ubiquinone/menaquinone biosynthesis C-methylase UbiE